MPKKFVRRIDLPVSNTGFGAPPSYSTPTGESSTTDTTGGIGAVPEVPQGPLAPTNLHELDTTLSYSGTVAKWIQRLEWNAVDEASSYLLQWIPASYVTFDRAISVPTNTTIATFEVFAGQSYIARVKAYQGSLESDWSAELTFVADVDTTLPDAPTDVTAVYDAAGNLLINWTNPTNTQLRDTIVDIFPTSDMTSTPPVRKSVAGSSYVWPIKENLAAGGWASAFVRVSSRSYALLLSLPATPAVQPVFATLAAPTVTPVWDLRTGTLTLSWPALSGAASYLPTFETVARTEQIANSARYTLEDNKADHSGLIYITIAYKVQARDAFGRLGGIASASTTAPNPPAPTDVGVSFDSPNMVATWSVSESVAGFQVTVDGISYTTQTQQFVYTFERNGLDHSGTPDPVLTCSVQSLSALNTLSTATAFTATNPVPTAPTSVSIVGGFSQFGATVTVALPSDLKHIKYAVSNGAPYDTVLSTDTTLIYTPLASGTYLVAVSAVDVFGQESAAVSSSAVTLDLITVAQLRAETTYSDQVGNSAATLAVLKDDVRSGTGVTYIIINSFVWTQASRPRVDDIKRITIAANGGSAYIATSIDGTTWRYFAGPLAADGHTLTEKSGAVVAQGSPVALPTDGYWDLPSRVECRFVQVWHKHTATRTLYEFYPRRLIQSDDIEAEAIKAIHIGAGEVTADKIDALAINGMTITGATVQTAASGQRVALDTTGLKTYNSSNVLQVEASTATGGALTAGAGGVKLDASGMTISPTAGLDTETANAIRFVRADGSLLGRITGVQQPLVAQDYLYLKASAITGRQSILYLEAQRVWMWGGVNIGSITGAEATNNSLKVANDGTFGGGLNLGTSSGAHTGAIRASNYLDVGGFGQTNVRVMAKGADTSAGAFTFYGIDSANTTTFYVRNDGAGYLKAASWAYGSDEKLKKNIRKYDKAKAATDKLKAIEVEQFDYIDGAAGQVGYVAQSLQQVIPDAVTETPDGTLAVRSLEPWLVLWLQQQQETIEALQSELAAMKAQIAALSKK